MSGLLGTFTAIAPGDTASSYSARIDWGDGNATFATLTPDPDGTFNVQGSNTYADPGVYAVRVLITHLSDGQTLALNATVFVGSAAPGFVRSRSVRSRAGKPYPGELRTGEFRDAGEFRDQANSGDRQVTTTADSQTTHPKKKNHPKLDAKAKHKSHPVTLHKAKAHPVQGAKKLLALA